MGATYVKFGQETGLEGKDKDLLKNLGKKWAKCPSDRILQV